MSQIKEITIVGNNVASYITAGYLNKTLNDTHKRVKITLIVPDKFSLFSLSGCSSPHLVALLQVLGIREDTWMDNTGATFNLGTQYKGWSTQDKQDYFWHTYGQISDNRGENISLLHYWLHDKLMDNEALPLAKATSETVYLCEGKCAPKSAYSQNLMRGLNIPYGYQIDELALAEYLHDLLINQGVNISKNSVKDVKLNSDGMVEQLVLENNDIVTSDLFIDLDGNQSILRKKVGSADNIVKAKYPHLDICKYQNISYKEGDLYNEQSGGLSPYSIVEKSAHGYACFSSLMGKSLKAMVFSSDNMHDDNNGEIFNQEVEVKNQPISNTYVKKSWVKNVVFLGKSLCDVPFMEGMEYALLLIGVRQLLYKFPETTNDALLAKSYNKPINEIIESTIDFNSLLFYLEQQQNPDYLGTGFAFPDSLLKTLEEIRQYWDYEKIEGIYSMYDYACFLSSFGQLPKKSLPITGFFQFEQSKRRFQAIAHRGEQAGKALPSQTDYFHQLQRIKSFQNEKF